MDTFSFGGDADSRFVIDVPGCLERRARIAAFVRCNPGWRVVARSSGGVKLACDQSGMLRTRTLTIGHVSEVDALRLGMDRGVRAIANERARDRARWRAPQARIARAVRSVARVARAGRSRRRRAANRSSSSSRGDPPGEPEPGADARLALLETRLRGLTIAARGRWSQ
jgi:hypothetical protein